MPTNPNMVAIQTVTVGSGGSSTIDFQNIPQTYTDLVIYLSTRQTTSSFQGERLYFNNTDSNLQTRYVLGNGSGTQSASTSTGYFGSIGGTNTPSNSFANTIIYISKYSSTSIYKSYIAENVAPANATMAYQGFTSGVWNSTSAITRVTLFPDGGGIYAQFSSATLYGVTAYVGETGGKAIGGTVTSDANYWYHTFTTSGMFTPTQSLSNVDYLVVAGGGGSGYQISGGGGAGGVRCTIDATGGGGSLPAKASFSSGVNYSILVGAGGSVGTSGVGSRGGSSSISGSGFTTISCTGGGGSGWYDSADASGSGGSGAGGAATAGGSTRTGGTNTANEGYAGGNGTNVGSPPYKAGSGGGAGAAGKNSSDGSGTGGNGIQTSISGVSTYYGGGGGAGSYNSSSSWAGGLGGGGAGNSQNSGTGNNATSNTGGGGGGNGIPGANNAVGSGGSGIVIIRYAK
jgi:hypothetical protein